MPSLKPVGHHSTRLKDVLALREATAALQSRGTTSPRYRRATAMYLPLRGSQTTIWLLGSKHLRVLVNGSEAHEENILQGQIQGLEALVAALGGADNRRVTDQGVVDSGVRDQVRLELVQ